MGLFGKNSQTSFEKIDQLLARVPDLRLGEATLRACTLTGGWRKNTPKPGLELKIGQLTGWLEREETLRYTEGTISIHETWNGSPDRFFISTPASAPADSAAGAVMASVPAGHTGILHPAKNGKLELVTTLDPQQVAQLGRWLRSFPRI